MKINPLDLEALIRCYIPKDSLQELASAVGDTTFVDFYLPVLERYVARVGEIPFSEGSYSERGGAVKCGFFSAHLALKLCSKTIFQPKATAQERMTNDDRYRWMAFMASLAVVYLCTISKVSVTFDDGTQEYSFAEDMSLVELGKAHEVSWTLQPTTNIQATHLYLNELFFPGQLAGLTSVQIRDLAVAINPTLSSLPGEGPLAILVRTAINQTIEIERKRRLSEIPDEQTTQNNFAASAKASLAPLQQAVDGENKSKELHGVTGQEAVGSDGGDSPNEQKEAQQPLTPTQQRAVDWLRGLAAMPTLQTEIRIRDGGLLISRKALGFGGVASNNYSMLHEAGFVAEKREGAVLCNEAALNVFNSNKLEAS
jgi:hypothetical protein